jgi:gas vesicle protein GvpL/GvpF/Lsr2 protein
MTVCQLPPYAHELNPVEPVWSHLKRSLASRMSHMRMAIRNTHTVTEVSPRTPHHRWLGWHARPRSGNFRSPALKWSALVSARVFPWWPRTSPAGAGRRPTACSRSNRVAGSLTINYHRPTGIRAMATVTQVTLTCDMCGDGKDIQTRTFGLDGKIYKIDLCPKDSKGLSQVAAGYVPKARKSTARHAPRHNGRKPRSRAGTATSDDRARQSSRQISGGDRAIGSAQGKAQADHSKQQDAKEGGAKAKVAVPMSEAQASGSKQQKATTAARRAARATGTQQQKGVYVYGILPAGVEMAAELPGVGESPGLLRVVRSDGLAALISEVDLSRRLGSPEDLKTYRDILDATATEVPVLPLPFGTVLASEDAVAEELLAAHHEQFTAALEQLDGRTQFVVQGRYHNEAVLGEVWSQDEQAARLRDEIQGNDPDGARDARTGLGEFISEAVTAQRQQDTRAVLQAMDGHCVTSVVREPAHERDAVHVVFLLDAGQQCDAERMVEDLAREWEGRIEVQLLGPMAAYDFVEIAKPEG